MTKFSFILPIRNRAALLKRGLQSIDALDYDHDEYEVIISDYLSQDNLIEVVHEFRGRLNMTYLCIDVRRYVHHKIFFSQGACNPALAQNLAVKHASGKHIILTSPEIVHWTQNLKNLDKIENLENKFVYGKVLERKETEVFAREVKFPFENISSMDSPIRLCDWDKIREPTLYFFGVMNRKTFLKYGGIDEHYMTGIAYDDEDFGKRMDKVPGLILEYCRDVRSVHLTHDRSYQAPDKS